MNIRHKAVLVGCGSMSGAWLSALRTHYADRVEVVGLVDLNEKAITSRAAEFGLEKCWGGASLEEALRVNHPDMVFNCTIPEAHAPTCIQALKAGCHVLVEKPLAPTVAEGQEMLAVASKAGKTLAVIQNRRYLPGAVTVQRALKDGIIGNVNALHVDFFLAPRFGGFREEMSHPLLRDMAIHTFDQCRFLADLAAKRVTCYEFNPKGSWFAQGASATALFEMNDGILFNYRGSWCARGFPTSWAGSWRLVGERGTLLWDGGDKIEVERTNDPWDKKAFIEPVEQISVPLISMERGHQEHAGNIGEFLDAVDSGKSPQTGAADNLKSLAMVEAAIESAQQGKPVTVA